MKIVTLCGSLKYQKEMIKVAEKMARKGFCVLTPVFPVLENDPITEEQLQKMKEAHLYVVKQWINKSLQMKERNRNRTSQKS